MDRRSPLVRQWHPRSTRFRSLDGRHSPCSLGVRGEDGVRYFTWVAPEHVAQHASIVALQWFCALVRPSEVVASSAVAGTRAEAMETARQFVGVKCEEVLSTIWAGHADFSKTERQRSVLQEGDYTAQEGEELFGSVEGLELIDIEMETIEALFDDLASRYEASDVAQGSSETHGG